MPEATQMRPEAPDVASRPVLYVMLSFYAFVGISLLVLRPRHALRSHVDDDQGVKQVRMAGGIAKSIRPAHAHPQEGEAP